jgi:DNA-binding Xre family transcriptional regulator
MKDFKHLEDELSLKIFISEKIKFIQKKSNIKYKDIKKKGLISHQTQWSRIRSGDFYPSIEGLHNICKALDCKSSDILPF